MRSLFFIGILIFSLITLNSSGQNIASSILNFELPVGSSLDNKPESIKKYTQLLKSFAAERGFNVKGNVEIIKTDLEAFKEKLSNHQFTIAQEGATDFYTISKNKNKYLAYIKTGDATLNTVNKPSNFSDLIQSSSLGVGTTIGLIKR